MRIEVRDDSVLIDGYVNAVERDSKVITDASGKFIEKIASGAFRRSLERANRTGCPVKVLLNHNYTRVLSSNADDKTHISEDNIGLRCRCEIRDKEVIEKARNKKLVGWSFGFIPIKEERTDEDIPHRTIRELELKEVSILDDTRKPAYNSTSIEIRAEELDNLIELRFLPDEVETVEVKEKEPNNNHIYENRYMELRAI